MYTYNSFLNTKKYHLNENQVKIDQEEAVSRAIAEEKIIITDVPFPEGSWKWNRDSGDVDFGFDVKINDNIPIRSLKELGFTFGKVGGNFDCSGTEITDLIGSPKSCKNFDASNTNLKSLEGSPYMVYNFDVISCLIGSLKGAPKFVFGDFDLSNNMITDISGGPFLISGKINLLGNNWGKPNQVNYQLFRDMHKFITGEYMKVSPRYAAEGVEEALQSKEYFINILSENVDYVQFFKEYYNADLADPIIKLNPGPAILNSIRNNLPLVWEEIIKIQGEDSGHKTAADLGDLGF
jgi:hypothetical protein